ncbi:MAG: 23S rRNA (pseudouridine(1915)-N(3))-methyltransferase RlmH [Lachnospiraceae bacterium]|nr:23S rRNA (pseudouridine(1915)-N(3))-methyltransferase RlmH [Lachnospiraceae bacterium]
MNVTVYCVGKVKEDFYRRAVEEYSKRLSRYCRLQIVEVADEKIPDHAGLSELEQIRNKEGERLLSKMREDSFLIVLAIEGEKMDSICFSETLDSLFVRGVSDIGFVIGGSVGLSEEILKRADLKLSFSDMTFPHQLMRVILLEQVYRAYRIMRGEPYHK